MEALLLTISLAFIPVYAFASGGVQVSHALLGLFMVVRLLRWRSRLSKADVLIITLVVLIMLRESYSIFFEKASLGGTLEMLYIAFACVMTLTFSRIPFDRPGYLRALLIGLVLAIGVALWGLWYYGAGNLTVADGELTRSVGTFNNPNQLAYFSVCAFSISSLLYLRQQIGRWPYGAFLIAAVLLSVTATSKAGLVALGGPLLIAISAMLNNNRISGKLIIFCFFLTAMVIQFYSMGAFDDFQFVRRLESIGMDSDDNLAARGYFLPTGGVLTFLFGMGQAELIDRVGHEVHSTFWSFMVKYGLIGFTLFIAFCYQWARRIYSELGVLGLLTVVMPPVLYGMTHNGSRFAIFWLLIGLSLNISRSVAKANASPVPPPFPAAYALDPRLHWQGPPPVRRS